MLNDNNGLRILKVCQPILNQLEADLEEDGEELRKSMDWNMGLCIMQVSKKWMSLNGKINYKNLNI